MDMLRKIFPLAFRPKAAVKDLVITLLILVAADIVCGFIIGLLGAIPIIGLLFSLIGSLVGLYFFVSIILAVLDYLKVLK